MTDEIYNLSFDPTPYLVNSFDNKEAVVSRDNYDSRIEGSFTRVMGVVDKYPVCMDIDAWYEVE